jgi:hypothetical protein
LAFALGRVLCDARDGMRRTTPALALAAALCCATDAVARRPACPDAFGSIVYRCTVRGEDGTSFDDCYRFAPGGDVFPKFQFASDQLGTTVGCTCQARGTPAKPVFGRSADFSCASQLGVAFSGRVKRNGSITKGTVTNAQGGSYVFECSRDETCTLP